MKMSQRNSFVAMVRRPLVGLAAVGAVAMGLAPAAQATLLVYEGFDYTAGANGLNSKNGGTGYSAGYSAGNNADVVTGSFAYTDTVGRQLVTSGNRALMDSTTVGDPNGASVSVAPNRNLNTANFASLTGPLYISFMGQQTAGDQRDVTVALFAATNGAYGTQERLSIGHGNPSAAGATDGNVNWGAYATAVGQQGVYSSTPASTLSLVVVRVDLNVDGALDQFRVYVNPQLGTEPAAASAESSAYDFLTGFNEINRVRMRAGGSNAPLGLGASQLEVDEIRIGTTYADVTPMIPASLAGDANYNGKIDADDFAMIDRGFAKNLGGWSNGDFDNNGVINSSDYMIIDQAFLNQGGTFSPDVLADREAMFGAGYVAELTASVPEPATVGALTLGAAVAAASRRRRR
jgi:hypothetical protein